MSQTLEISQQLFDSLVHEAIGVADLGEDKLADTAALTLPGACFTTTTVHTHGTC